MKIFFNRYIETAFLVIAWIYVPLTAYSVTWFEFTDLKSGYETEIILYRIIVPVFYAGLVVFLAFRTRKSVLFIRLLSLLRKRMKDGNAVRVTLDDGRFTEAAAGWKGYVIAIDADKTEQLLVRIHRNGLDLTRYTSETVPVIEMVDGSSQLTGFSETSDYKYVFADTPVRLLKSLVSAFKDV